MRLQPAALTRTRPSISSNILETVEHRLGRLAAAVAGLVQPAGAGSR